MLRSLRRLPAARFSTAAASAPAAAVSPLHLVCSGCGTEVAANKKVILKCPNASAHPDVDHVLEPAQYADLSQSAEDPISTNPFVRYRSLLYSHRVARSRGMSDTDYVSMANGLNDSLEATGGKGFAETPLIYHSPLNCFFKVEVDNVAQSHKARHLANTMLYLLVLKHTGEVGSTAGRRLAVASCGNAGLAAAEVAAAAEWPIDVCIPPDADDAVKARLAELAPRGVAMIICDRSGADVHTAKGSIATTTAADPTFAVMSTLVQDHFSIPFSVQGSECGLAVQGGHTMAWEILTALKRDHPGVTKLNRMYVQVGGGALGAGLAQGMRRAIHGDATKLAPSLSEEPALHCVQPIGCQPLDRAWSQVQLDGTTALSAAKTRKRYMRAWDNPKSVAHGILDDETYDWVALCDAMERTRGGTLAVDDELIRSAHSYAHSTLSVPTCHTGAAGLAGLMQHRTAEVRDDGRPPNLVVLSGLER